MSYDDLKVNTMSSDNHFMAKSDPVSQQQQNRLYKRYCKRSHRLVQATGCPFQLLQSKDCLTELANDILEIKKLAKDAI